jgi:hypothetical protein
MFNYNNILGTIIALILAIACYVVGTKYGDSWAFVAVIGGVIAMAVYESLKRKK